MSRILITLVVVFYVGFSYAQWTPDPFCPYPSEEVTRYPYYGNCSVYWECYEGTKYVMECPEGTEFNAPMERCDFPEMANCDPFASTTSNPNPPTHTTVSTTSHKPGPDCPFPSDDITYFPYSGDCTMYWECFEGNAYLYVCPEGLWWHQAVDRCDYPGPYCDNSNITTTPPTTTSNKPTIQPACNGGDEPTFYPYDGDCSKYWECVSNELYLSQCPQGLWWHQSISRCDVPGDYCQNSTETTTTTPEPTTPSGVPSCEGSGNDPIFYPYQGDCSKYWECVNGFAYIGECAEGLWWHQVIGQCDYPGDYCDSDYTPSTPTSTERTSTERTTTERTTGTTTKGTTQDPDNITCPDPNDHSVYFPYAGNCTMYWECFLGVKYLNTCPDGLWWHEEISLCDEPGDYCRN